MPHELFESYVRAPVYIEATKSRTVPISMISHGLVIAVVVLGSALVPDALPVVPVMLAYVAPPPAAVPPPPAPPSEARPVARVAASSPHLDAAPVSAPSVIKPDPGIIREPAPAVELGTEGGATGGVPGGVPGGVVGSGVAGPGELLPPPPPVAPIRVSSGMKPPIRIKDVTPVYPGVARLARISGTVIIDAVIGSDGRVTGARVLRSIPALDQAALDAVHQWLYTPTIVNGGPVAVVITVTVSFTLR